MYYATQGHRQTIDNQHSNTPDGLHTAAYPGYYFALMPPRANADDRTRPDARQIAPYYLYSTRFRLRSSSVLALPRARILSDML